MSNSASESAFGIDHGDVSKSVLAQRPTMVHVTGKKGKGKLVRKAKTNAILSGHKVSALLNNPKSPLVTPNNPYRSW